MINEQPLKAFDDAASALLDDTLEHEKVKH